MTEDRASNNGKRPLAKDNYLNGGQHAAGETAASERRDVVVLSIARLIGRQLAREHFEALRTANNITLSHDQDDTKEGSSGPDDAEQPPEC